MKAMSQVYKNIISRTLIDGTTKERKKSKLRNIPSPTITCSITEEILRQENKI